MDFQTIKEVRQRVTVDAGGRGVWAGPSWRPMEGRGRPELDQSGSSERRRLNRTLWWRQWITLFPAFDPETSAMSVLSQFCLASKWKSVDSLVPAALVYNLSRWSLVPSDVSFICVNFANFGLIFIFLQWQYPDVFGWWKQFTGIQQGQFWNTFNFVWIEQLPTRWNYWKIVWWNIH